MHSFAPAGGAARILCQRGWRQDLVGLRPVISLAVIVWTVVTGPLAVCGSETPNIVFVLIDDLRHDTFSHMNHPFVETPHIDGLATGGMRFTNAFVTTSLCSPSRASFLTGQFMHHHKVVDNADLMPQGTVTFPQLLQTANYETAFIGKWHMGGSSDEARPGFDHWVSFRGQGTYAPDGQQLNVNGHHVSRQKYMTDELTDYAVDWIHEQSTDQPFLLYLSHKGVHGLYDPAPRHRDRYVDAPIPTLPSYDSADQPMWVHDQRNSWHGVEFPYHGRSGQTVAQMYRHYCEMILSIDDSIGRVMQTLRQKGVDKNTLVIFTSDGGHLWGEHGLIDKRCAYEESIRIPMLAHCPNMITSGSRCEQIISNIDVAPTLLQLAGVTAPAAMDGRSFLPLLKQTATYPVQHNSLLYEYYWEPAFPQTPTTFSLRDERYKLIQYHGIWDSDELFDLQEDPAETTNLIHRPEHQRQAAAMRRRLHERLLETDGLSIPLGIKRNHGATLRRSGGSNRAEFPDRIIQRSDSENQAN